MSTRYQFLAHARKSFAFLERMGFHVETEREGTYASFKDGFTLVYRSKDTSVDIDYSDMELEVRFRRNGVSASYLFIDHNLHANASGIAGCMFPFEKLPPVIDSTAKDIAANYEAILSGDAKIWQRIEKLVRAPKERKPFLP